MALNLKQKQQVVADVAEIAASAHSVVVAEYHGLTVEQITQLRRQARDENVVVRVVKNSLTKRAVAGTDFECITSGLVGPLLLAFSLEDLGSAARVVKDFAKEHQALSTKWIAVGGALYDASGLDKVAALPTRDEALAQLLGTMQAPIAKLASTFKEVPGKFVRTLAAVKDAKEAA